MLDVIYDRRSIRKYQNKPIEDEKLNEILRAGMYAPSGMNKQPWTFVVCTERNTLDEVQKIHKRIHCKWNLLVCQFLPD